MLSLQAKNAGEGLDDVRTGMPPGIPEGAMCVQRFDDSRNSAIHTTYRISLRSSSMREPRDPLLKVLIFSLVTFRHDGMKKQKNSFLYNPPRAPTAPTEATGKVHGWVY